MTLFTELELERIQGFVRESKGHILVTFRNRLGPTRFEKEWKKIVGKMGKVSDCLNWWSSTGTAGMIECEDEHGRMIFGQWALGDETKLLGIFEVTDDDIANIRDGYDAGNVYAPEMRAIRIGETGDKD